MVFILLWSSVWTASWLILLSFCAYLGFSVCLVVSADITCASFISTVFYICLLYLFQIIPFYVSNATNYFGRIIDKHLDLYATLNAEMSEYFKDPSNKTATEKVESLGLYGLEEKTLFQR